MDKPLAVVTGASTGIGRAVADAFAREGHPVLLLSRHVEPTETATGRIRTARVDVADAAALAIAIARAEAEFGPTGILVNNAGAIGIGAFEDRALQDMEREIDVLFRGVVHGIKAVLPGMIARRSGTIVNISSIGDRKPGPSGEIYHACKAAVRSLGESLQQAEARHGVRVINVAPGFVKTNIHDHMGISFEEYARRLGNPTFIAAEELAEIVLFCATRPPHVCIRDIVVMPTDSAF
jgi:NADP-dependent 3-hydroxy acid dehydrogenase YdfG